MIRNAKAAYHKNRIIINNPGCCYVGHIYRIPIMQQTMLFLAILFTLNSVIYGISNVTYCTEGCQLTCLTWHHTPLPPQPVPTSEEFNTVRILATGGHGAVRHTSRLTAQPQAARLRRAAASGAQQPHGRHVR